MGINQALEIALSGVNANRIHMEIISSNIANINSTRTEAGGPYRRKIPIFGERPLEFSQALTTAEKRLNGGIDVTSISEDQTPFTKVFNPGHPDADSNGFVSMPNVSLSKEMVDMVYVEKLYEANITVYSTLKTMAQQTLQIQ